MTEQHVKDLGYTLIRAYDHDQYHTKRYKKGALEIEFSYEADSLVNVDLTISDLNCIPIKLEEIKVLTDILGSYEE